MRLHIETLESRRLLAGSPLAYFDGANGTFPLDLHRMANGDLYGTARDGGDNNHGTIFRIKNGSDQIEALASFGSNRGPNQMAFDKEGNIFGIANPSDHESNHILFELSKGGHTIVPILTFDETETVLPYRIAIDSGGNIFGSWGVVTDQQAGIFRVAKGSTTVETYVTIYNQAGVFLHDLIVDANDDLYGVARFNTVTYGSIIFKVPRGSNDVELLDSVRGEEPQALVKFGNKLYGINRVVKEGISGSIWECDINNPEVHTLAPLTIQDGIPEDIAVDEAGNIFVLTHSSGSPNVGGIFELPRGSNQLVRLAAFPEPNNNSTTIVAGAGKAFATVTGGDFGKGVVFQASAITGSMGAISGNVFNDANANGTNDAGESVAANAVVFLDWNNNASKDSDEPSANTDAAGNYTIAGLPDGTYTVALSPASGYRATFPVAPPHNYQVTIVGGASIGGKNFGGTKNIYVAGTVFNDSNSNGVKDANESALLARIYFDQNQNGMLDPLEVSYAIDGSGEFSFDYLPASQYFLRIVLPSGYRKTQPSGTPGYNITAPAGQVFVDRNFGLTKNIYLSGRVFNDINSNGILDAGEGGLPGFLVRVISNNVVIAIRTTDASGNWTMKGLSAGSGYSNTIIKLGWTLVSPAGGRYTGTASSGQQIANLNFGLNSTLNLAGASAPEIAQILTSSWRHFANLDSSEILMLSPQRDW